MISYLLISNNNHGNIKVRTTHHKKIIVNTIIQKMSLSQAP
jgi:hypothetical protein